MIFVSYERKEKMRVSARAACAVLAVGSLPLCATVPTCACESLECSMYRSRRRTLGGCLGSHFGDVVVLVVSVEVARLKILES